LNNNGNKEFILIIVDDRTFQLQTTKPRSLL